MVQNIPIGDVLLEIHCYYDSQIFLNRKTWVQRYIKNLAEPEEMRPTVRGNDVLFYEERDIVNIFAKTYSFLALTSAFITFL